MTTTIQVVIPNTLHDHFDYLAPHALPIGASVKVPFGKKEKIGIVISCQPSHFNDKPLKPIIEQLETQPLLNPALLHLFTFVAKYYQAPLSQVLTLGLPKRFREGKAPTNRQYSKPCTLSPQPLCLNAAQTHVIQTIREHLHHYQGFLLQGVTGSGKTEVYLKLIQEVIKENKQVLVLVPEIGLTPQLQQRFLNHLQTNLGVIHSSLSEGARHQTWHLALTGACQVVIGTRAALFTPFDKLGLIIVDEEHDTSYKQMEGVRYSARDMALFRAHHENIPIVLGSATPCLETLANCEKQKLTRLFLNERAVATHPLEIKLVDLRNTVLNDGLAPLTIEAIQHHLTAGHQVLIFINRRGFAPVLLCQECGQIADCTHCDAHLTLHQKNQRLTCHHCGLSTPILSSCKHCHAQALIPIGAGTQRIEQALQKQFKTASILRIDRDEITSKDVFFHKLNEIRDEKVNLIVGTQMLAKGHDFKKITLVVVLDTDQGLYAEDFRATERFGQLLTQVAGRAGRSTFKGQVLIQTYFPNHPALTLLLEAGYDAFATHLLKKRQEAGLPPYCYLALIRAQGRKPEEVRQALMDIKSFFAHSELKVLGPAPAPMAKKAGFLREQLLVKATHRALLAEALFNLRTTLKSSKLNSKIRISIDVDPLDMG